LQIVTQPLRGVAVPQTDGTIQYRPDSGFVGRDLFEYRISDNLGRASNVATVNVEVVSSRLQNPDEFPDVNDDGTTSALDALLIINELARKGGSFPVLDTDRGPNFLDMTGDKTVSALDALNVINHLSGQIGLEGEQVTQTTQALLGNSSSQKSTIIDTPAPIDLSGPEKIVDASTIPHVSSDVVDLIAADHKSDHKSDSDEESIVNAVDAAMADLL
jgi:hypothetical protein